MSLTGKYTSIYDVIERVRRSGINDFMIEEAKEWCWEAISYLGVSSHYEDKVAVLAVEDGRAQLPYDLYDLSEGGVREYTTKVTMQLEKDIFYDAANVGVVRETPNFATTYPSIVYVDGVQVEDTNVYLTAIPQYTYTQQEFTYKINHGFLFTGFKDGYVELAYKAFPVDNDGNPMIEDSAKVIRFVVAYIKKMVAERMWIMDELTTEKKRYFDQEYSFAAASARSDASIGSIDDWEAVRTRWMRLYRDPNLQRIGFKNYSYRENLKI